MEHQCTQHQHHTQHHLSDINFSRPILERIHAKINKDMSFFFKNIMSMQQHVTSLERPDANTSSAVNSFLKTHGNLEKHIIDTFDRHAQYLTTGSDNLKAFNELQKGLDTIREYIEKLSPLCSLSTIRPEMSGAHLGNVKFPGLKVKAWDGGPGFFQGVKVMQEFITRHPCQGDIYVTRLLDYFQEKANQPTSVMDIVAKVAFRFVKPSDEEQILLEALRANERLVDPSSAKTILNPLTREIPSWP